MTYWPSKAFWDELAGGELSIPGTMMCMQCGCQIAEGVAICPLCGQDPTVALPLDLSDFTDDDWEALR